MRAFCESCAGNYDLVRHLESFGLRCVSSGDITRGQDALRVERFDAPVITNPPFSRNLLLPLLEHFVATAPSTWLLLPADFAHVAYARPYLSRCTAIVTARWARWFGGSGTRMFPGSGSLAITGPALSSTTAIQSPRALPSARNAASPSSRPGPTQRPVRTVAGSACNGGVPLTVTHP